MADQVVVERQRDERPEHPRVQQADPAGAGVADGKPFDRQRQQGENRRTDQQLDAGNPEHRITPGVPLGVHGGGGHRQHADDHQQPGQRRIAALRDPGVAPQQEHRHPGEAQQQTGQGGKLQRLVVQHEMSYHRRNQGNQGADEGYEPGRGVVQGRVPGLEGHQNADDRQHRSHAQLEPPDQPLLSAPGDEQKDRRGRDHRGDGGDGERSEPLAQGDAHRDRRRSPSQADDQHHRPNHPIRDVDIEARRPAGYRQPHIRLPQYI